MKIILTVLSLLLALSGIAQVVPANRTLGGLGTWGGHVGVPGGIPYRTSIYTNFSSGASLASVQSAINSAPSNSVVYLSAGTYTWSSSLTMKSGVTLRGAGPGNTIINSSANNAIYFNGYNCMIFYQLANGSPTPTRVNWTNGYTQGTNVITLDSVAGLSVGENIWIDQLNDTNIMPYGSNPGIVSGCYSTPSYPSTGQDRWYFQMNLVTAINGHNVTLAEPIYGPFFSASQTPQAWWEGGFPMVWSGVEDLSLNCTAGAGTEDTGIWGDGVYACWIRNVSMITSGYKYYTSLSASLRCETRHCTIEGPNGSNPDIYGFYPKLAFGGLYIDNIDYEAGTMFMIQSCSGDAFAYNYMTNCQMQSGFYLGFGYYDHGGNPNMLLFEGNWGPSFGMDSTWGSSGYNTAFRNRFTGNADSQSSWAASGNEQAITISYTNRNMSIVGNVLGTTGHNTLYQVETTNCTGAPRVYWFGGSDGCSGTDDPYNRSTVILAYNWDSANSGVVSNGFNATQIPLSLLFASAPTNFGILAWPPVDPANVSYSTSRTNIPAGYRFINGIDPPAAGTQPIMVTISGSPTNGTPPTTVNFSSSISDPNGAYTNYWNFGDGTGSSNTSPSHVYSTTGTNTVTLFVGDSFTNATSSAMVVTITNGVSYYILMVTNGTGSGLYTNGTVVTIVATVPTGLYFTNWSGSTNVSNTNAATTTITMATNSVVTAQLAFYNYTLTVTNGTGSTTATNGQVITISANAAPPGLQFANWSGANIANTNSATTTVTMPNSNAAVTVNYKFTSYTLTVNGGTGSGSYTNGQIVTITATNSP